MARKKTGLALGAGSAKGFAHLGVLRVFEENNIPVDYIAGSSMGAVVGGVYSTGIDIDMTVKLIPQLNERQLFDISGPSKGGLIKGRKFENLIDMLTKGYTFSQTKIPFCCVAVDLYSGKLVAFNDPNMKIEDAIRASLAIPALIKPHQIGEEIYVDGGVLCRVPNTQVRDMGADVVISVDVGYRGGQLQRKPVSIVDHAISAFDIMGWEISKNNDVNADVIIAPDVLKYDSNTLKDFEAIVRAGEIAATEALPKIKELLQII